MFQRWIDGQWDIWQLTQADGRYEALTDTSWNEREPDYSPDGTWIWFNSSRSGTMQIWRMRTDGSGLTQMTDDERATFKKAALAMRENLAAVGY